MKMTKTLTALGIATLTATSALAATTEIKSLPKSGNVTLEGVVESVQNEREFTLRDNTGKIGIDMPKNQSVVLKVGSRVTVSGEIDRDIAGVDINANRVDVHNGLAQAISDNIEGGNDMSLQGATAYEIKSLPDSGLVKVTGMVSDVDDERNFTVKDTTGKIDVKLTSAQTAALTEGARVTVIGRVDKGLTGKDLEASQVIVLANAKAKR